MAKAKIQSSGKAKWTVMVYIAGDNNLDGAALWDIKEMAQAGSTKDVNILVQLDRLADRKTRRFLITKGGGYDQDCIGLSLGGGGGSRTRVRKSSTAVSTYVSSDLNSRRETPGGGIGPSLSCKISPFPPPGKEGPAILSE